MASERVCKISGDRFAVTDADLRIYEKFQVPVPTLCPEERLRRRLSFHNERSLYWRSCDTTGKRVLSLYHPDTKLTVYDQEYYWSDKWDARSYGRTFDFDRSFFEQWRELKWSVPHVHNANMANENSDYTSYCSWNKDCYLIFHSDHNRGCLYSDHLFRCVDCCDCYFVNDSELCYQCIHSNRCYDSRYLEDCEGCSESWFLQDCIGCKRCFACSNLRNKEYYFFNERCTPAEYKKKLSELQLHSSIGLAKAVELFRGFSQEIPRKAIHGLQNEDVSGDYLSHSMRLRDCFNVGRSRDCAYLTDAENCIDCYDVNDGGVSGGAELLYECETSGEGVYAIMFSDLVMENSANICYSNMCVASKDLFGCIGLRHAQYCIFNTQYTRDEYNQLRAKLLEHMRCTGEWGEFFPIQCSPFAYNETLADDFLPLKKEDALLRGYRWRDDEEFEQIKNSELLECRCCSRGYSIQKYESVYYQKNELPPPQLCHECRHTARQERCTGRTLHNWNCSVCNASLRSAYDPQNIDAVLCEKCHQQAAD